MSRVSRDTSNLTPQQVQLCCQFSDFTNANQVQALDLLPPESQHSFPIQHAPAHASLHPPFAPPGRCLTSLPLLLQEVAAICLRKYGWQIESALNAFWENPGEFAGAGQREASPVDVGLIDTMFETYKGKACAGSSPRFCTLAFAFMAQIFERLAAQKTLHVGLQPEKIVAQLNSVSHAIRSPVLKSNAMRMQMPTRIASGLRGSSSSAMTSRCPQTTSECSSSRSTSR
jgi:hypothetical protein